MQAPTEAAVALGKGAMVMNHLKNNRIEYLVLVLFSHVLGLTDLALSSCLLYTSPSPRDMRRSRMPSSA